MKKSMLALAIFFVLASATQAKSSAAIYGIIDTGIVYTNDIKNKNNANISNKFELKSHNMQSSHIGFKGTEDLGAGIKIVFNMETSFINNGNSYFDTSTINNTLFHQRSVIGLNNNFGTVLLGRQTNFANIINIYTSIVDFGNFTSNAGSNLSRLQGNHTNNSITYTTNNLNGFTSSVLYGFSEKPNKISDIKIFGIGSKYERGPLGLGLNYYENNTNTNKLITNVKLHNNNVSPFIANTLNNNDESIKIFNIVASYQFKSARIYGNWSHVKQNLNTAASTHLTIANRLTNATLKLSEKANMYELGTTYKLNPTIKLLASMQHTEANFNGLDGKGRLTQINLGTNYILSKRTDLYVVVSNIRSTKMTNPGAIGVNPTGSDASQTAVGIGIKHKF